MPTQVVFYRNCDCCSGSGSGSGSCGCSIFSETGYFSSCSAAPVNTDCKTGFVLNVRFDFTSCGSSPFGSCGSTSGSGGGPSTGGDFEPTGSGSDPCNTTCPGCCELIGYTRQMQLTCVGGYITSSNRISTDPDFSTCTNEIGSIGSCLAASSDCDYFWIAPDGSANLVLRMDYLQLPFYLSAGDLTVISCNPLEISGIAYAYIGETEGPTLLPCVHACFGSSVFGLSCIKATLTITEA